MMFERVRQMLIKEFFQVLRDPKLRIIIFLMPVIQGLVFGYAVTTDVRHIQTAVYDLDHSVAGRELISRFGNSGYFDIVEYAGNAGEFQALVDTGKAQAVLHIDSGYQGDLDAGRPAAFQVIVDGTDSNTAGIVLNYSSKIVTQYSQDVLKDRLVRLQGVMPELGLVELKTRAWFNENLESRNYYVPGVIAILVTLITLMLTSMAIVREKEIGTMEQILVTPITPLEFILGKTVPFALIGFIDVTLITVVGIFWFDVPFRGSLLLLFFSTALFLMTTLGVGLLISTVSETQQQAMMSTFFFYFPAILLSGFMFPIANMPVVIQWLTYFNPLRYFLVIVRGIFLKGIGSDILWPQMVALAIIGVLTLWLASRRFKKTLA
ncbi:transport permease protein [Desulforhabdus amnigena]|uniref:Transport permease protein n=2 Tax=Desulforhabdus amnigena TaxID=40218 RepID=A0A9W6D5Z1_9BACT|nr:transport permease protein [Desulforhabdus amnigena]